MDLFIRPNKSEEYLKFRNKISKEINHSNFLKYRKKGIKSLMNPHEFDLFLTYRFELFNFWFKKEFRYTQVAINKLDYVLDLLYLKDLLNVNEQQFIYDARNVVFSKKRNLKNILNTLKLKKNEYPYFVYKIKKIRTRFGEINSNAMYISNKHVIIEKQDKSVIFIPLSSINNRHLYRSSLAIYTNDNDYYFYYSSPEVLYSSLERMLNTFTK